MTIVSAALLLFLVIDPVGNIPFFLSALRSVDELRQKRVIIRELLIALVVLVLFLFSGRYVLQLLRISEPALTIAGGVILFLIALRMIFPTAEEPRVEEEGEPFLVPLAIPYAAGPSALATELVLMSREPTKWLAWLLALLLAWFSSSAIIFFGSELRHCLGQKVLLALERPMGLVLVAVAVQMLMTGITQFLVPKCALY